MRTQSDGNTPWNKIRNLLRNPTVEVILAIVAMFFAAWIVIDTESELHRSTSTLPVLFGYK